MPREQVNIDQVPQQIIWIGRTPYVPRRRTADGSAPTVYNTRVIALGWPEAERERFALPDSDVAALINADAKLAAIGPSLGYSHSSAIQGVRNLRELRPRGGRCRWRAFYRQIGDVFIVAAVGPEAMVDKRGFSKACQAAVERSDLIEEG